MKGEGAAVLRETRRFRQQLPHEECEQFLRDATSGVLAVYGEKIRGMLFVVLGLLFPKMLYDLIG